MTTINVGFFADNDMQLLPFAAQFGMMPLPYGAGRNAPVSNEDIARVIAAVLARPAKVTREKPIAPPALRSCLRRTLLRSSARCWGAGQICGSSGVGGGRVMKGMGFSDYSIAQTLHYAQDYRRELLR